MYKGLNQNVFTTNRQPEAIIYIEDLEAYNEQEGLALSKEEMDYLKKVEADLGRKLTDSEVFGFSQVNSEHCRHKIFNGTGLAYTNMSIFPDYNVLKDAPQKNIIDQNVSDYWLESGDYVNIEHLTMGFNIPMKSKVVKSLRLSASISNLATITGYSGLTPMINSYVVSNTLGIDDKRTYPLYRTYSLGLSVQF